MKYILNRNIFKLTLKRNVSKHLWICRTCYKNIQLERTLPKFTSKEIREMFLSFYINKNHHTFVQSSPVFLNSDPSLLFVNAGMNQFRSLLLNKLYPSHPFYNLKRATNSQKCIRLSGKHNDLQDVGMDVYHHTFFEMLGNWSFGDYSKLQACKMSWDLLTNTFGLNPDNLYVTYFDGGSSISVPADEESKSNWLNIGVPPDHIFPFSAKNNFWEMGASGPCGPCTEIHYDFLNSGSSIVSQKINCGHPDVIEIWNLVFIEYSRGKNGELRKLPVLNIDTGMGFERLVAVLQGTSSNYDTDIFVPIFKAIENNFKIKPYTGKTGLDDIDGLDTAYRIVADHSRMISVAVADGLFPDNFDAGHILRKIIRRAAYASNKVMKSKPGVLSTLASHVAETLDFFPEINKSIEEIKYIINDEEKMFHSIINKGRKARNKMVSKVTGNVLDEHKTYELHEVHGLEDNIIEDLASEAKLVVNWSGYEKLKKEKQYLHKKQQQERLNPTLRMDSILKDLKVPITDDIFKYKYSANGKFSGTETIISKVNAIFNEQDVSSEVSIGLKCVLVTDKSNFYSEAGGQSSDVGKIFNNDFSFDVDHVISSQGYVYHFGTVVEGRVKTDDSVKMEVNSVHRLACSQNHTATHLLNSILRKMLFYTTQRSSSVGPNHLHFGFSCKTPLDFNQLKEIEYELNSIIQNKFEVSRKEMPFEELLNQPNSILLRGEEYPDSVSVIIVKDPLTEKIISIEPCCGTHVLNTCDIGSFLLTRSKSSTGSTKFLSAVTGEKAIKVKENGKLLETKVATFQKKADEALTDCQVSSDIYKEMLKEVKALIKECQSRTDVSLILLEEYEESLKTLKLKLTDLVLSTELSEKDMGTSVSGNNDIKYVSEILQQLKSKNVPVTDDSFKYNYDSNEVRPISSNVVAILNDYEVVDLIDYGLRCQLILDKTNFYAEEDDQRSDEGVITCEDFTVRINNVYKAGDYVVHDGYVEKGTALPKKNVMSLVSLKHRLSCSQNHSALHLLNSVMKQQLPYFFPYSAKAGSKELELNFSTKTGISDKELKEIEERMNQYINKNLYIKRQIVHVDRLKEFPQYKSNLVKSLERVPVISIVDSNLKDLLSVEPCFGTHVSTVKDIQKFIIISYKNLRNNERTLRAVTGDEAAVVCRDGEVYDRDLTQLEDYVSSCLNNSKKDPLELWDCLKEIKIAKVYHDTELPLLLFRTHQNKLTELARKLTQATNSFVQKGFEKMKIEMQDVQKLFEDKDFIVYQLSSVGDAKKISNYATENSNNKPALYFVRDGHKSAICSCSVPKEYVTSKFSALLWINPVASYLNGKARSSDKDPQLFYSIVCDKRENIEEAINIANKFAQDHLKK